MNESLRPWARALALLGLVVAISIGIARGPRGPGRRPAPPPPGGVYQLGDTVRDFPLPALKGGQVPLASFRGKVLLLNFWASW